MSKEKNYNRSTESFQKDTKRTEKTQIRKVDADGEHITDRTQTVWNTEGGSIVSDGTTGNKKIQITSEGGGNINLNGKVNSEFAPNNKQTLVHGKKFETVAGDNFETTKSNKEQRVEGDLTIITGSENFFTAPIAEEWIEKNQDLAAAKAAPEYNYGAVGNNTETEYADGGTAGEGGAVEGGNYTPSEAHADVPALMEAKAADIAATEAKMGTGGNIKMMTAKHMFINAGVKAVTFDSGVMVPNARKVVKQYEVDGGECKPVYTAVSTYESKDTSGSVPFGDVHIAAASKFRVVTGSGGVSIKSAGEVNINSTGRLMLGGSEAAITGSNKSNTGRITMISDTDMFQEAGVIATRVAPNINDVASIQHSFHTPKGVFTGDLHIKGNVTVEGPDGIRVPAGDVIAGSVSLKNHTHGGVCAGSDSTSGPNGSGSSSGGSSGGGGGGGAVNKIIAGNNITISPSNGEGDVTINSIASSTFSGSYDDLTNVPTTFNTVSSFSGSYNDLTDQPTILDSVAVLAAVAAAGYTDCEGTVENVTTGPYLTGGGTVSAEIGIDSACASKWDTAAAGDVSEVTTSTLLSGGGTSGSVNIGIDSGALSYLDQSGCLGINCEGDITEVTTNGDYLTGGGLTGAINIGLDASCAAKWDNASAGSVVSVTATGPLSSTGGTAPVISLDAVCDTTWNSAYTTASTLSTCLGLDCEGTITSVCGTAGLSGSASSGAATIGIAAGTLTPFDQSSCPGINCIGDVVAADIAGFTCNEGTVTTAGALLSASGDGTTIGVDSGALSYLDQSALTTCAGLNTIGTVEGVTTGPLLSGGGTSGCFNIGIDSGALTYLDQSACLGLNCTGDVEGVTVGPYLTGGGETGCFEIGLDSACAAAWDAAVAGGITAVTTTSLLSGGGTSGCVEVGIDSGALSYLDQSACLGLNKTGTVTGSTAGALLSTDNNSTCINFGINSGALDYLNQSACPGLLCEGDITSVFAVNGLSGTTFAGDATIGVDAALVTYLDQSTCLGINCTGDVEGVTVGPYLTGGGESGCFEIGIDSACASAWDAAVAGGITAVTTTSLLSGGGTAGCVEVGIDSGALTYLDQSACLGLDKTGTVTGSTAGALLSTNNNSSCLEFGINSGALTYLDQSACPGLLCEGDITGVFAVNGLSGSTFAGDATIGVDAALVNTLNQSACLGINCTGDIEGVTVGPYLTGGGDSGCVEVGINSACAAAWDAAVAGGGTVSGVTATTLLSGGGTSGCFDIGIDSGALSYLDQSGCLGLDKVGDITAVFAVNGLSGGAFAGDATVGVDAALVTYLDQSACLGLNCEGTVVASDLTGFTCNEGTVTSVGALLSASGDGTTIGIDSGALSYLDQSGCLGLDSVGDITAVFAVNGLSGTTFAGDATIGVDAALVNTLNQSACLGINCEGDITEVTTNGDYLTGGGLTGAIDIGLDIACAQKWDNASAGSVVAVTGGDGIDSSGGTSPDITVDATVVRTCGTQTIAGSKSFSDAVCINGGNALTDALLITNDLDASEAGPIVTLKRNSDSPADGDYLGQIKFKGENDADQEIVYAKVTGKISDVTDGTEDGLIETAVKKAGSNVIVSRQTGDALKLINDTGLEVDGNILSAGSDLHDIFSNCQGDITSVSGINGLSGSALAGAATIGIDSGTLTPFDQSACLGLDCEGTVQNVTTGPYLTGGGTCDFEIGIDSACAAAWDAAVAGGGTINNVTAGTLLSGGGTSGCVNIGIDSGALSYLDQSGCLGLDKVGDITGVFAVNGLSGSTFAGDATIGVDAALVTYLDQSSCPGLLCEGDITAVIAGPGLSGTALAGDASIGIDSGYMTAFDQSACPGINATGTMTTASTLLSTDGCNVGIDSGALSYLDQSGCAGLLCEGDITSVAGVAGLSGSALAGAVTLGIDSGTLTPFDQSACAGLDCEGTVTNVTTGPYLTGGGTCVFEIGIDSACAAAWDAAVAGGVTEVAVGALLSGGGSSGCVNVGIDSGALSYLDQSGCLGLDKVGDITGVFAVNGLSGSTFAGDATIGVDAALVNYLDQSACLGINCEGDITAVIAGPGLSGTALAGDASIGIDSGYMTAFDQSACPGLNATGTVTTASTLLSTDGCNVGVDSGALSYLDQSGCAGLLCEGDITSVSGVAGLSGSALAGAVTIGIAAGTLTPFDQSGCAGLNKTGTVINVTTGSYLTGGGTCDFEIGLDSACAAAWDAAVAGGVTEVTTSSLLSGGGTAGSVEVGIDAGALSYLDQSGCLGLDKVGDITAVFAVNGLSGGAFAGDATVGVDAALVTTLNQSACLGLDCEGTVTTAGALLSGSATTIGVDSGALSYLDQSACLGLDKVGTITTASTLLSTDGCAIGIDSGALSYLDQSGCAGLLCEGDITSVIAGPGLSGTALAGDARIGIDSGYMTAFDQSNLTSCPGLNFNGTVTNVTTGPYLTGGGTCVFEIGIDSACAAAWDAAVAGGITEISVTDGLESTGGNTPELGIAAACNTKWDQSGCAGLLCEGDITAVFAVNGLSGTTFAGDATIGIDSGTLAPFDQSACLGLDKVGIVTEVTGGVGITVTDGATATPDIAVDNTVVRTIGNQVIGGTKHFTSGTIAPSVSATGLIIGQCITTGAFMESNAASEIVYSQGTVLALNEGGCVVESTESNSTMIFGVATGDSKAPIVMGAEPICVTGDIKVGDYITSSDKAGHGMKSTSPYPFGTIIAQAMESCCGESFEIKAMIRKM